MSSRTFWIVALTITLVFAALVGLFWVQNSSRTVQLSFELWGLGAWQMSQPISLPALLAATLGTGFVLGWLPAFARGAALRRRVRQLEQQAAFQQAGGGADWR